jgi:hypothetical protein
VSPEATSTASAELDYADYVDRLRAHAPDLAEDFTRFTGISSALAWMKQRNLCGAAVDIVGQDEFHYDFLIQLDAAGRWLSFGVT